MKKLLILLAFALSFNSAWSVQPGKASQFLAFKQSIKLGDVKMNAKTKKPQAYQHFELGMAFLHAFMYELAIEQFQQAQRLDPQFSMAYWGEAMAYKHPLWNVEQPDKARAVLSRYHANKGTQQVPNIEQAYLNAVTTLYEKGDVGTRAKNYLLKMRAMHEHYPNDVNVSAFYALSLMGVVADTSAEENGAFLQEGRALINQLFKRYPTHPGVVHYTMHYFDESQPRLALQGVEAAKTALEIMNSSSHVAHMSAHIYRRLGRWPDYNYANEVSIKAADTLCLQLAQLDGSKEKFKRLYACNADNKYHSLEWLHYGYLQTDQPQKAHDLLKRMEAVTKQDDSLPYLQWYYRMWARQRLFQANWTAPTPKILAMSKADGQLFWSAYTECGALLAKGLSAVHSNNNQVLGDTLRRLNKVIKLSQTLPDKTVHKVCQIHQLEIQAAQAWHKGNNLEGESLMERALLIQRQTPSTALSPSLDFSPVHLFFAHHLSQYDDSQSINTRMALYREFLKNNINDERALKAMKKLSNKN